MLFHSVLLDVIYRIIAIIPQSVINHKYAKSPNNISKNSIGLSLTFEILPIPKIRSGLSRNAKKGNVKEANQNNFLENGIGALIIGKRNFL